MAPRVILVILAWSGALLASSLTLSAGNVPAALHLASALWLTLL